MHAKCRLLLIGTLAAMPNSIRAWQPIPPGRGELQKQLENLARYRGRDYEGSREPSSLQLLDRLEPKPLVREILLEWLTRYRNAPNPETALEQRQAYPWEYQYLRFAVYALGHLKERRASLQLGQFRNDRRFPEGLRLLVARALADIDTVGNRDLLLDMLDNTLPNEGYLRTILAEPLSTIKDWNVLSRLEYHAVRENSRHNRLKIQAAADRLRASLQGR